MARDRHRGHREGSVYQRKDGRWVAALTLESGKRFYAYARTQQEAMQYLREKKQTTKERPEEKISMVLADLPFKSYRKITYTHARILTQADHDERKGSMETQEATSIPFPFELHGQHGQAGDYVVKGVDSTWIIERALFETCYQSVTDDERRSEGNNA